MVMSIVLLHLLIPVNNPEAAGRIIPDYCLLVAHYTACPAFQTSLPRKDYLSVYDSVIFYGAYIGAQFMGTLSAYLAVYVYMWLGSNME